MKKPFSRGASTLAASALMLGGMTFAAGGGVAQAAPGDSCDDPRKVSVFEFNDFHGRISRAAGLFTPVEEARAEMGEDNVLLVSTGDNIGGSTFDSFINDDNPTIDIMNAAGVEAIATGNHEFDKGWADLSERVIPRMEVPHTSTNIYDAGTTTVADPLEEYVLFEKGGVTIAYVGAVTGDLPSLVSPAGITEIDTGDPVEAVNRVGNMIVEQDLADIVIAGFHEGAPDGEATPEENAAMSPAFDDIYNGLDQGVFDVVFNGHTHEVYNWETLDEKPLMQAGQYAEHMSRVDLMINSSAGELCSFEATTIEAAEEPDMDLDRIAAIQAIAEQAAADAAELGAEPVGVANEAISTPLAGDSGTRNVESPMTNMVAQMFKEQLQTEENADSFIGIQNPGGTRDSFDAGTITYEEAANVTPFANSLMTIQLTGAQFKMVLEQQWQPAESSRPFLALGLSDNVSYTLDESRDEGDRITSISIDGEPINMEKLYTLGSGSFLISGGDNFFAFNEGINMMDSGRVDLEAFVDWIDSYDDLSPDYTKRGVSAPTVAGSLTVGAAPVEYVFGQPLEGGVQVDTLDMLLDPSLGDAVSPPMPNTTINAYIGDEMVGGGDVVDGVGTVQVAIATDTDIQAGNNVIDFVVQDSGTVISLPVTVKAAAGGLNRPVDLYTTPGYHKVNGRQWITACEPYSITERCTTFIYGTDVQSINGKIVKRNGWMFNNLTYKPSRRSAWTNNPLGYAGSWTSDEGRRWMTECDTARTGNNACRSYIESRVVESIQQPNGSYNYRMTTKFIFNNIVQFS